jgi:alpha-glucosidase (family GH31 glycosyl hydrolase)
MSDAGAMNARRLAGALVLGMLIVTVSSTTSDTRADFDEAAPPQASERPRPPLTPRWVFEPWAWEDEDHNAEAVNDLVDGYQSNGIPIGAVIIDSPWATNYNTFDFNARYPNPAGFVSRLKQRGVRTVLWATGVLNVSSIDGPVRGKVATFDEALALGYFVNAGQPFTWYKGVGSAIDFFNPAAVSWWEQQLDRAMSTGVAGWKVDYAERDLPSTVQTAAGAKTIQKYGNAYYRAFYRHAKSRDPEAVTLARPYDKGEFFAPVDANPVGWVGDQTPSWGANGIDEAVDNMLVSAEHGYAVVGSDIGGYNYGSRDSELFVRWAQLGALSPLMENGGRGEHRPWKFGPEVLDIYRRYAILHHELVPYLYSLAIEAHTGGQPILRRTDRINKQYMLGPDLLVAPNTAAGGERPVDLPEGERWYDYWDDDVAIDGPARLQVSVPLDRVPLYIRAGAILPLHVEDNVLGHGGSASRNALTLLIYPTTETSTIYRPAPGSQIGIQVRQDQQATSIQIGAGEKALVLRVKEAATPRSVASEQGGALATLEELPDWATFNRPGSGWYYDAEHRYLWIRSEGDGSPVSLSYER